MKIYVKKIKVKTNNKMIKLQFLILVENRTPQIRKQ